MLSYVVVDVFGRHDVGDITPDTVPEVDRLLGTNPPVPHLTLHLSPTLLTPHHLIHRQQRAGLASNAILRLVKVCLWGETDLQLPNSLKQLCWRVDYLLRHLPVLVKSLSCERSREQEGWGGGPSGNGRRTPCHVLNRSLRLLRSLSRSQWC